MIKVYTKEDYAKSYTEIIEILKYFSKEDLSKIPKQIIEKYINNRDKDYKFLYDENLKLEEQNISKLTIILFANLYIEYFLDENERKIMEQNDIKELKLIEKEKQEKYSTENIFKNRKKQILPDNINVSLTVVENKGLIKKIIDNIKKFLKLT